MIVIIEYRVKNVRGVDGRDGLRFAEAVAEADIAATAVGVTVLRFIAAPFAGGREAAVRPWNRRAAERYNLRKPDGCRRVFCGTCESPT